MLKVTYLPGKVASKLTTKTNVIAIRSPYDAGLQYAAKHNMLSLSFFNNCDSLSEQQRERMLSSDQAQQIIDFVKKCAEAKEDIVVHCGEGRIRSPAVACFIEYMTSDDMRHGDGDKAYMVSTKMPGCIGSDRHMDRDLFWRLRTQWDNRQPVEESA